MALEAAARKEPQKERTPRVDWAELLRKTFDFEVLTLNMASIPPIEVPMGENCDRLVVNV